MIRPLEEKDLAVTCEIVNVNWKSLYRSYVNPQLLTEEGCLARTAELREDFSKKRLSEFVFEEAGRPVALLSFGDTADADKKGSFEIWRIYIAPAFQDRGIGTQLLAFAEQQAKKQLYTEIVIWAFKENANAVSFYQKHRYRADLEMPLGPPYLAAGVRFVKQI